MRSDPRFVTNRGERSHEDDPLPPRAGPTPALVVGFRAPGAGSMGSADGGGSPAGGGECAAGVAGVVGAVWARGAPDLGARRLRSRGRVRVFNSFNGDWGSGSR